MAKEKSARLWADPEFCILIKKTAVGKGMSYLEFTRKAAREPSLINDLENEVKDNKKKKGGFDSFF